MTEQEFLNTKIQDCQCGNKVKPTIEIIPDMGASLRCPSISCSYCGKSSGAFYPDQFEECLAAWRKKKSRSFDEIIKEIDQHIEDHGSNNLDVPPFKLDKQDAVIAFSMLNKMNKERTNKIVDAVLDGAINSALNEDNYSYLARMLKEGLMLMHVPLAVGWGERQTVTGPTMDRVRHHVDLMGSNPDDCMILESAGRYVTTAMDYR